MNKIKINDWIEAIENHRNQDEDKFISKTIIMANKYCKRGITNLFLGRNHSKLYSIFINIQKSKQPYFVWFGDWVEIIFSYPEYNYFSNELIKVKKIRDMIGEVVEVDFETLKYIARYGSEKE